MSIRRGVVGMSLQPHEPWDMSGRVLCALVAGLSQSGAPTKPAPAGPMVKGFWDLFDPEGMLPGTLPAAVRLFWLPV